MVGCVTGRGIPTPFQGLVYRVREGGAGYVAGYVAGNTPTPETGLGYPFPPFLAPYVIGGYAYINPLAGLILHITCRYPPML